MGTARASGPNRAQNAALEAITSPLLENMNIEGAHGILLNITGGTDLALHEISEIASIMHDQCHPNAHIIIGAVVDEGMQNEVSVTLIATGFERAVQKPQPMHAAHTPEQDVKPAVVDNKDVITLAPTPEIVAAPVQAAPAVEAPEVVVEQKVFVAEKHAITIDQNDLDVPTFLRKESRQETN